MKLRSSVPLLVLALAVELLPAQEWCDQEKQAYTVLFINGAREYVNSETSAQRQNALETQNKLLSERFKVQEDGSILDKLSGLVWSRFSVKRTNSGQPINLDNFNTTVTTEPRSLQLDAVAVATKWRLPTASEIQSVLVTCDYADQHVRFNWQDSAPYYVVSTNVGQPIGIEIPTGRTCILEPGRAGFLRLVSGHLDQSASQSPLSSQETSKLSRLSMIDWWRSPGAFEKKKSLFDLKAEMDAEIAWRKKMVLQSLSSENLPKKDILDMSREELAEIARSKREHEKKIEDRDRQLRQEMDQATKERIRKMLSPIF